MTADRSKRGGAAEMQRERALATRVALMETARGLFAQRGFHGTSTAEVATRADVTVGAVYHHFADKKALFEAVHRAILDEARRVSNSMALVSGDDSWTQMLGGFEAYLDHVGASEEFKRVVLIDGPAVFGWTRWRALQSEYVAQSIEVGLSRLMDSRVIDRRPTRPLANLIQAVLYDVALTYSDLALTDQERFEARQALRTFLEGLHVAD